MLQLQQQQEIKKEKEINRNSHHGAIYEVLIYLSDYRIPLTKYRISSNKKVLSSLLSKKLIDPIINKDLLSEYVNVPHYVISPKGMEFIKRYEHLQQLLI